MKFSMRAFELSLHNLNLLFKHKHEMAERGKFDWEKIYEEIPLENMGWYHDKLDADLDIYLSKEKLNSGTFLDLGSGAGNQANELAKIGFTVTGTDISSHAINKSSKLFDNVEYIEDDILNSKLNRKFDYIFDRGCFHCIDPNKRAVYVDTVSNLLLSKGSLFLKCFNKKNPNITAGPFQFTLEEIRSYFEDKFEIIDSYETEYQGTLKENPKALFSIMKKK